MPTAASSARADTPAIVIALAVAALGAAALLAPDVVLKAGPPCLITALFGDVCWGCGITRAALAFLHGDLAAAWGHNRLSLIVMPLLFWIYIQLLHRIWLGRASRAAILPHS